MYKDSDRIPFAVCHRAQLLNAWLFVGSCIFGANSWQVALSELLSSIHNK